MVVRDYTKYRLANGQIMVTIPKEIARHANISPGDRVLIEVDDVIITIRKEEDAKKKARAKE